MVVNGFSGPGDWGKTSTAITGPTGSDVTFTSTVVTGACCSPSRIPTYTEAKEKQEKEKRKKNNQLPPWLRGKTKRGQF